MSDADHAPLVLRIDGAALVRNWRALRLRAGPAASCGAAVKANAYGLGAVESVTRLYAAGCRDFFVATWAEAAQIADCANDANISVLNGVLDGDMAAATASTAKPMLNSVMQIERWRGTGLPCDVMINSGMNRLGIDVMEAGAIDWRGLHVDILASHLACADEDVVQNRLQREAFATLIPLIPHMRTSLANSAGIALNGEYAFDLSRPGLSLYGGVARAELTGDIDAVATIEVRILQIRNLSPGDAVGYNATYIAAQPMRTATLAIGYADGYRRAFSNTGIFYAGTRALPVIGRVSMDLVTVDITAAPELAEGDIVTLPWDLPKLAQQSGVSPYELLTGLGNRLDRVWTD